MYSNFVNFKAIRQNKNLVQLNEVFGGGEAADAKVSKGAMLTVRTSGFSDAPSEFACGEFPTPSESVMNEIKAQAAEISESFSSTMRYRRIEMPNPTEALTVIGRDTLNYCCNYGEE